MSQQLLDVRSISLSFGGLKAVSDFTLQLGRGDLQGLIGPNGAGKTTVFNLLTGIYRPDSGDIRLCDSSLAQLRPHQITAAGIARTFQNIRLFPELSVLDNVRTACHVRARHGICGSILGTRASRGEERAITERALELLAIFQLETRPEEQARNLCYGDQRRLEIARALATDPKVLLLDEPAAGMNPQEKRALRELIRLVREKFELTVLLIEHDMGVVMDVCEKITVLDHGETIAVGTPAQIQCHPKVIEAYLGAPAELPGHAAAEAGSDPMALLEIKDVDAHYGAIHALHGIDMRVEQGQIVTLIGSNGAGKSSTLRVISGLIKPTRGTLTFEGRSIVGMAPHEIVRLGIAHAPEGRGIFANLTVDENLQLGGYARKDKAGIAKDRERSLELFPRLRERLEQRAGTLSGGEQQMLAIARALIARPKLLLLDEPSLGLAPQVVQTIFKIIREINATGTTILLVEQNAHMALHIAHHAYVIEVGSIVMSDKASVLAQSDAVRKAYLGVA